MFLIKIQSQQFVFVGRIDVWVQLHVLFSHICWILHHIFYTIFIVFHICFASCFLHDILKLNQPIKMNLQTIFGPKNKIKKLLWLIEEVYDL